MKYILTLLLVLAVETELAVATALLKEIRQPNLEYENSEPVTAQDLKDAEVTYCEPTTFVQTHSPEEGVVYAEKDDCAWMGEHGWYHSLFKKNGILLIISRDPLVWDAYPQGETIDWDSY